MCEIKLIRVVKVKKTIVDIYYKLEVIAPSTLITPSSKLIDGCFKNITELELFNLWIDIIDDKLFSIFNDNDIIVRNAITYFNRLTIKISIDRFYMKGIDLHLLDNKMKELFNTFINEARNLNRMNKKTIKRIQKTEILDITSNNNDNA